MRKREKDKKPKEYIEVSIKGGEVDERLQISRYESSEESDAVEEFKQRADVHESLQEEALFELMLERYCPKNYQVDVCSSPLLNLVPDPHGSDLKFSFQSLVLT